MWNFSNVTLEEKDPLSACFQLDCVLGHTFIYCLISQLQEKSGPHFRWGRWSLEVWNAILKATKFLCDRPRI